MQKENLPHLRLKKLIEVLSQYSIKVKFLQGKDMAILDFLSRHQGQDVSSPNEKKSYFFSKHGIVEQYRHSLSIQENTYFS